jgi:hypothetical protein
MSEVATRTDRWASAAEDAERRRDEVCEQYLAAFSTPAGQRVLLDLEALVYRQVILPAQPEAELRDHMGQKRLLGIIMERLEHARRKRASGAAASQQPGAGRRTVRAPRKRRAAG